MSEKRFTDISCSETGHIGVTDCGIDKEFTSDEFEDFLNELNDENDILKQQLQTKYIVNKQYEELQRLKKENEQLKNDVNDCDFVLCQDDFGNYEIRYNDKIFHFLWEVAPILNKQQAIIQSLKEEVNKLNEELYYCEKFRYQVFQGLSELNGD